jgi:hypothetical protein
MQRQGKKLAVWLETWFGPDAVPEQVTRPAVEPAAR